MKKSKLIITVLASLVIFSLILQVSFPPSMKSTVQETCYSSWRSLVNIVCAIFKTKSSEDIRAKEINDEVEVMKKRQVEENNKIEKLEDEIRKVKRRNGPRANDENTVK
jgi:peptidoglycan hydrolase CwlO-like protein